jgi:outer membrane phospholipase A
MCDYICFSFIKSFPIVNDYFIKFYTSNHCSMFDEQINCINQRKDDHHHQVSMHIQSILLRMKRRYEEKTIRYA